MSLKRCARGRANGRPLLSRRALPENAQRTTRPSISCASSRGLERSGPGTEPTRPDVCSPAAIGGKRTHCGHVATYRASETGAGALGISVQPLGVREPNDFDQAFDAMNRDMPDAILMVSDPLTSLNRKRVFEFAAAHRLPAIYEFESLAREGGLMSYGPDTNEGFARVAALVDRILKGAKPADLPFEQPTRFRFVLNLKTAKSLGLTVPLTLQASADEVIE